VKGREGKGLIAPLRFSAPRNQQTRNYLYRTRVMLAPPQVVREAFPAMSDFAERTGGAAKRGSRSRRNGGLTTPRTDLRNENSLAVRRTARARPRATDNAEERSRSV